MTPLGQRLVHRIVANGPMTVADYMAACLGDPEHGYYITRDPLGAGGDFITAPEISQMFGELIGAFAVATWLSMGSPGRFLLAELGPGRGTLMADLLRAARVRPGFLAAADIRLVETSPVLRRAQERTLGPNAARATWHSRFDDIPDGPLILLANEFFDALPIRQFVRRGEDWAERMIGLDDGGRLAFGLRAIGRGEFPEVGRSPGAAAPSPLLPEEGAVAETSPAAVAIADAIGRRVATEGGAALIVDYGHEGPAVGDTLQAVRGHAYDDPLASPGEADLTAHVDFGALARAAASAGARPRPLQTQGRFLAGLGLAARAAALSSGLDSAGQAAIAAAAERLAGEEAMGTLFKVLALSHPALALPLFDDDA